MDPSGSAAKAEAPSPPEFARYIEIAPDDLIMLALIVGIAAQTFPRKASDFGLLRAFVDLRRPPIKNRHCFSLPKSKDYNAMILRIERCRKSPIAHRAMRRDDHYVREIVLVGNKPLDSWFF
jgi:hypothetical protein